ncbi:MAG: asparagine synthase (glutamine-hydrolyzing) [Chitinophagaceae bacterium]|nr:asparagine synthase (glutamine-hydrolyzing) [Chitinophagaceae bacterium]
MCGIAGIISGKQSLLNKERLQLMSGVLQHRGPDGTDHWINMEHTAGLCHTRLAIIDLTSTGRQPMPYLDRYTIVYNGEIYNYIELRKSLESKGYSFRSSGDTEVILAAYACYGKDCLQYFDGMFAFALWDQQEKTLFAARDRLGEKPLFYHQDKEQFLFASEMKALWAAGVEKQVNNTLLLNYLTTGSAVNASNASATFYTNILKLPAAHYLLLQNNNGVNACEIKRYWQLDKEETNTLSEQECIEQFRHLFFTSVQRRRRADVKLGTSLSGGLDSSSIVAALLSTGHQGAAPDVFSAVFPGFEKDESSYIRMVQEQYGLHSFTVTPSADGFIDSFEKLCYHQEEPFQSSSVYAQYKVYELAKQNGTTILLDGQGADETLAGYHKYYHWYWQQLVKERKWQTAFQEIKAARANNVLASWGIRNIFSSYMPSFTARQLEKRVLIMQRQHPGVTKEFIAQYLDSSSIHKPVTTRLNDVLYFNTVDNGLEELLRYADRNSMAHSTEVRLPFLSHELVQFVFSLPASFKIKNGYTKWILRKSMHQQLLDAIVWRKDKTGFEPPQQEWMQHPRWQDYFQEAKRSLVNKGILKASLLGKAAEPKHAHAAGNYDWQYLVAASMIS